MILQVLLLLVAQWPLKEECVFLVRDRKGPWEKLIRKKVCP